MFYKILALCFFCAYFASAFAQNVAQGSAQGAATNCRQAARGDIFSRPPFLNQEKYSLPELRKSMSGLISFQILMTAYPVLSAEIQIELLKRYHENGKNKESREFLTLYLSSLKLAHGIARKTQRIPDRFPDYFQMASIKLMESIDNFDLSYDVRFITYAYQHIYYALVNYRYGDRLISSGVKYKKEAIFVRGLLREDSLLSEDALLAQLERHPEYNPDQALYWYRVFTGGQEANIDQMDLSFYEKTDNSYQGYSARIDYNRIKDWALLKFANQPNDLVILRRRIFSNDPATLPEIGAEIGVTGERVRQMENIILDKIRRHFRRTARRRL